MIRVLGRANSINVQKVMWCAAELGIDVKRVDMGLQFGGNNTPEYLAKNPNGLVPTLEDGDTYVWESNTIVRYLADKYGTAGFALASPEARAWNGQWMDWFLTVMAPTIGPIFRTLVRTPEAERDMKAVAAHAVALGKSFAILDDVLATRDFIGGDQPSTGDIPVGCAVYRWYNMAIERPALANVAAWYDRLQARPAYQSHVMMPLT
ncbi:MAG: glutathione S-transferase family protein [Rhodospirillaceae bacterium]